MTKGINRVKKRLRQESAKERRGETLAIFNPSRTDYDYTYVCCGKTGPLPVWEHKLLDCGE